jgi:class 3 adenylate cyclase
MHRRFLELLPRAEGRNEWVAAINADIRGFTSSMSGDPAETALYLRRVYSRILENYFAGYSFFKPTGDGLLLVVPFEATEEELVRVTVEVVSDALRLVADFPSIVGGDKLVRFPHPKDIGIGVAAGSVSRITADDTTLDYTGRALNVASRLMDLARPSGVVCEATLDFSALPPEIAGSFTTENVYLKGVAERDAVEVFYTREMTRIPERYRQPMTGWVIHRQDETITVGAAKKRGVRWITNLTLEPADSTELDVRVRVPVYRSGRRAGDTVTWLKPEYKYRLDRGEPIMELDYTDLVSFAAVAKLPGREQIRIEVAYPVEPPSR